MTPNPNPSPELLPMSEAPKDGSYIVGYYRSIDNERNEHWDGRAFVIRHEGKTVSDFDLGWGLFPGYGGVPDICFAGWLPLPAALSPQALPAPGEVERPRMSGKEWNDLPENARRYIMMLETDADPSGTIRSEMILRDYVELLEDRINETNACFDAAIAEGLYERLGEVEPDEQAYASLVDLVQRRLMYAYTPAPKRPTVGLDRHPGWTEAGHQWLDAGCPDREAITELHRLQHGETSAAKPLWGGPIVHWAVDEIKALRATLATVAAANDEGVARKWFPHLCWAGEPMREGQFREPWPMDEERATLAKAIFDGWYEGNEDWDSPHNDAIQQRAFYAADAAIRLLSQGGGKAERYRHVKRGTVYEVVGRASLQNANQAMLVEAACLVIYRGDDGNLWAREESEFNDGRFEPLATSRSQHEGAER